MFCHGMQWFIMPYRIQIYNNNTNHLYGIQSTYATRDMVPNKNVIHLKMIPIYESFLLFLLCSFYSLLCYYQLLIPIDDGFVYFTFLFCVFCCLPWVFLFDLSFAYFIVVVVFFIYRHRNSCLALYNFLKCLCIMVIFWIFYSPLTLFCSRLDDIGNWTVK